MRKNVLSDHLHNLTEKNDKTITVQNQNLHPSHWALFSNNHHYTKQDLGKKQWAKQVLTARAANKYIQICAMEKSFASLRKFCQGQEHVSSKWHTLGVSLHKGMNALFNHEVEKC